MRRAAFVASLAIGVASTAPFASLAAASDTPASIVASQVGSWNCTVTSPGSKAAERFVVEWMPYGASWIHGSADVPAFGNRPAHAADFALGYDVRQKVWISVYTDALGAYAVSKSGAPASARTMTFANAYPVDPANGPSVVKLGSQKTTIDSTWTETGARHSSHEACAKTPV